MLARLDQFGAEEKGEVPGLLDSSLVNWSSEALESGA